MKDKKIVWQCFEELPSTNDYAKQKRADGQDLFILAKRQSGGRGTKGRSFSSDLGGVYLSLLRFYEDFPSAEAFKIMIGAAVAVCETLSYYGLNPEIKWPNDVLVQGKKICGILIENTFSGKEISSSIVGVGLNVCNALPTELSHLATTMAAEGIKAAPAEVARRLATNLTKTWTMEDYRRYLGFVGEKIALLMGDERVPATLLAVSNDGKLSVLTSRGELLLSSAEVSLCVE